MAIYGVDFYGISFYGANTLVDFDASPFLATSTDYNEIELRWTEPSGSWSTLRLLRNPFGFPMTPDDGDLLVEAIPADDVTFYLDRGQVPSNSGLIPGHTYYYSIFIYFNISIFLFSNNYIKFHKYLTLIEKSIILVLILIICYIFIFYCVSI